VNTRKDISKDIPVKSIAIVLNPEKDAAVEIARQTASLLMNQDVRVLADRTSADAMGMPDLSQSDEVLGESDFALVLGGDGTLLRAARMLAPYGVPMLGVRLGKFGFLTDLEPDGVQTALARVMEGNYKLEERMMLQTNVRRHGRLIRKWVALNDVVIAKGPLARMLLLGVHVADEYLSTYAADGLIIATPTGSTAYSLSAGGPLVTPDLKLIIVTPICPHTLSARSLIVSNHEHVKISVETDPGDVVMATVDGQVGMRLQRGDEVIVSEADIRAKLISLDGETFYSKVQTRLKWGDRFEF